MGVVWRLVVLVWLVVGMGPAMADLGPIDAMVNPGELIKGHAKFEAECGKCHQSFDKTAQSKLCKSCHDHEGVAKDVATGKGYHGRIDKKKECNECHTDHKGRTEKIADFDHKKFDHNKTDYPLRGGHAVAKVKCQDCHKAEVKYRDAPSECKACHRKDDVHKGKLGEDCASCHSVKNWKEFRFDHDETDYPLIGKHVEVKCKACHENQHYKDTPTLCNSCHEKDDMKKGHRGKYGAKCETCHTERDWKKITFNHDKDTKYQLLGKHGEVKCNDCHTGRLYQDHLLTDCFSCHRKDDVHKGQEGLRCESCHDERSWKKARFDHDLTRLPLIGKHKDVVCKKCHATPTFDDAQADCFSCHRKDDVHKRRLGLACEDCHSATGWKRWSFDHNVRTKFALEGGHKKPDCYACHKVPAEKKLNTPETCYGCHSKDDKHKDQEGRKCETCHDDRSWTKAFFDHDISRFPLLGGHKDVKCKKCHEAPTYKDAKGEECIFCHKKDDTHKRKLGPVCEDCHGVRDWKRWDFDHDRRSKFPLEGAHRNVDCYTCHKTVVETRKIKLAGDCFSCHERDDKHKGGYGRYCEQCHVAASFKKIRLNRGMTQQKP